MLHIPSDRIEYDHRPGIPDVDQIINRGPAHIHPYFSFLNRYKFFFFLRQRIINFHLAKTLLSLSLVKNFNFLFSVFPSPDPAAGSSIRCSPSGDWQYPLLPDPAD